MKIKLNIRSHRKYKNLEYDSLLFVIIPCTDNIFCGPEVSSVVNIDCGTIS